MDDDVLAMSTVCAQALGWQDIRVSTIALPGVQASPPFVVCSQTGTSVLELFDPSSDPAQAFELLCWLAQHATVSIDMHPNIDGFFACLQIDPGVYFREQPISTPAELRLALMRATVKVHEGRGK